MSDQAVYHEGELIAQQRAGATTSAQRSARVIGDRIPTRALAFVEQATMAAVGSRDDNGNVWATLLLGEPGFLRADDPRHLVLDTAVRAAFGDDPLWENLASDPQLGLLLIDLDTRLRLRVNGRAQRSRRGEVHIKVEHAYANCPKYIQRRQWHIAGPVTPEPVRRSLGGEPLDARQRAWIERADTLFVASAHPRHGVDASHRGGRPGFVRMLGATRLRVPDFVGNGMFNTLGNFVSCPRAGLALIDFDHGRMLQLVGTPTILWDADDPGSETGGTARYWELEIDAWRQSGLAFRLASRFIEYSPFIPGRPRAGDQ
jgi:predicted pyridoxine 5'-phosphate oxidase superfamily flavin-nucleotide-binding protein